MTEPILYRHFDNKQDLFVAIVREMSDLTLRHWQRAHRGTSTTRPSRSAGSRRQFPEHMKRLSDAYHVLHGALATSRDKKVLAVMQEHYRRSRSSSSASSAAGRRSASSARTWSRAVAAWQLIYLGIGITMISLNLPGLYQGQPLAEGIEMIVRGLKGSNPAPSPLYSL